MVRDAPADPPTMCVRATALARVAQAWLKEDGKHELPRAWERLTQTAVAMVRQPGTSEDAAPQLSTAMLRWLRVWDLGRSSEERG